ncbi:MAG: hypothetical protein ACSLEI_00975 [Candidatus Carsonella ruddii]
MNNFEYFLNYIKNKKFNFCESIDLNIIFINKKKKYFNFLINLFCSINCNKNFLFLSKNETLKKDNIFIGNIFLNDFLKKKILFNKIYYDKNNFSLIKKMNLNKKFSEKKFLIYNYKEKINNLNSKIKKININKNNYLNIKIGNINFTKTMIEKNFFLILNNLKKNFFIYNIYIKKIFLKTTMSKIFAIK